MLGRVDIVFPPATTDMRLSPYRGVQTKIKSSRHMLCAYICIPVRAGENTLFFPSSHAALTGQDYWRIV